MEKLKIEVLTARNKYVDQIHNIYKQNTCSNGGVFSDKDMIEVVISQAIEQRKRTFFVCAIKDEKVLGFIHLSESWVPNSLYIAFLAVDENHRREGVASMLLEYVIHHSKGYSNLSLSTAQSNELANKLYMSMGFECILNYEVLNFSGDGKIVQNFYNLITKEIKNNKKLTLTQTAKEIKEENRRYRLKQENLEEEKI